MMNGLEKMTGLKKGKKTHRGRRGSGKGQFGNSAPDPKGPSGTSTPAPAQMAGDALSPIPPASKKVLWTALNKKNQTA